jgi:hypothetical protein
MHVKNKMNFDFFQRWRALSNPNLRRGSRRRNNPVQFIMETKKRFKVWKMKNAGGEA